MKPKDLPLFDTVNKCQSGERNLRMKKNKKTQPAQMDNSFQFLMEENPLHLYNGRAKTKCTKWVWPDYVGHYLNACH